MFTFKNFSVYVEGFSSCAIFHPGKQVNYVSLQSQCLPRLIRVSQNNRYFSHVIKSIKGFHTIQEKFIALNALLAVPVLSLGKVRKVRLRDKRGSSHAMN